MAAPSRWHWRCTLDARRVMGFLSNRPGRRQRSSGRHALAVCAVLGVALLGAGSAAAASTPTETVQALYAEANRALGTPTSEIEVQERLPAIRMLFAKAFDFRGAARRALGDEWRTRTAAEQNDFTALFAGFVERGFVFWLVSVATIDRPRGGVAVSYLGEQIRRDRASVRTSLGARGGRQVLLDYDMVRVKTAWVVDDVTIDGISLVANYRAQFERVIRNGSYRTLVERMRERVETEIPRPAARPSTVIELDKPSPHVIPGR